jgi:hypothetical protein
MVDLHHLSHSSVESYARCGEAFRLQKVEKIGGEPSWALIGGSAVHLVTETLDFADFGIDTGGPTTFAEGLEVGLAEQAQRGWAEEHIRTTGRKSKEWPNARDKDYWIKVGQGHVDRWRNYLTKGMDIAVINGRPAIEIEFLVEFDAADGGKVPFLGYIDRILESPQYGAGVVDLKSGASIPESQQQLREYALSLQVLQSDLDIQWAAYYMTDEKHAGMTAPVDLTSKTPAQVTGPILTAWRGIQNDLFMPNIGRHCGSCFVRHFCQFAN